MKLTKTSLSNGIVQYEIVIRLPKNGAYAFYERIRATDLEVPLRRHEFAIRLMRARQRARHIRRLVL